MTVAAGVAGETATPDGPGDGGEIQAIARTGEPDRYLAAVLAPPPQRDALLALAAFSAELARIPSRVVREPLMGELRLEWWRTALTEADSAAHGVAHGVRAAVRRHRLPAALLDELIDARGQELDARPFADAAAVDAFLWGTEGTLFALAAGVTGGGVDDRETREASAAAGRAYGRTRLLQGLPRSLSLGRVPLAASQVAAAGLSEEDLLAGVTGGGVARLLAANIDLIRSDLGVARQLVRRLPGPTRHAFLPLALVEPYVRMLERRGDAALRTEVPQILPLVRVWRIAAAHLFGRL